MNSSKSVITKIFKYCKQDSFFEPIYSKNNEKILNYRSGVLGSLFQENLKKEWINRCLANRDYNLFLTINNIDGSSTKNEFLSNFSYANTLCNSKLPFGFVRVINYNFSPLQSQNKKVEELKEQINIKKPTKIKIIPIKGNFKTSKKLMAQYKDSKQFHSAAVLNQELSVDELLLTNQIKIEEYLTPLKGSILQVVLLLAPSRASEIYYQWQRQRKIWWRKFSNSPGRFNLSNESLTDNDKCAMQYDLKEMLNTPVEQINVTADFDSESLVLEKIQLYTMHSDSGIISKDINEEITPMCLISTINLHGGCIGLLGDYVEDDTASESLQIHRRLAPYQCNMVYDTLVSPSDGLEQLGVYLCGLLRTANISTLHKNWTSQLNLDKQCIAADKIGIPYCLILSEDTLKNGIAYLRNRDTLLKEQIHVSDVPKYIDQLCKPL